MLKNQLVPKLTVCGSFGFGNAGDEALPLAISDLANHLGIDVQIQILGRFNKPALPQVIGLDPEYEERQRGLKESLILVAGGGVIEPLERSVLFRCAPYLRKSFASTIGLYAANVEYGTKYKWLMRWKIKNLLREFDRLYVRDVLSANVLKSIVPKRNVEVIGDAVLWMKPSPNIPQDIESLGSFITVHLASHVSWKEDSAWHDWISTQLSKLAVELKAAIVFVPLSVQANDDIQEHRLVANKIHALNSEIDIRCIEDNLEPRQISALLGRSILTIGMRLHGCVMAYAQKTPFVALVYHPKVFAFAKTVGWEEFCLPKTLPAFQSPEAYGYTFYDTQIVKTDLCSISLKALEYSNFEKLELFKNRLSNAFVDLWNIHNSKK